MNSSWRVLFTVAAVMFLVLATTTTIVQAQDRCGQHTVLTFNLLVSVQTSHCIAFVGTSPDADTMENCCKPIKRAVECDCAGVIKAEMVPSECKINETGTNPSCTNIVQAQDRCVQPTVLGFDLIVSGAKSQCIAFVGTSPDADTLMENCCKPIKRVVECDCGRILRIDKVPSECKINETGTHPSCYLN